MFWKEISSNYLIQKVFSFFSFLKRITVDGKKICYIICMDSNFSGETFSVTETQLQEPKQYHVIFLNDDYTTMEFVTDVLQAIFHKSEVEAEQLMKKVHVEGAAVVGIYTYDIAVTRINLTIKIAREQGFPLRCEMKEV